MCELDAVVAESAGGRGTVYGGTAVVAENTVPSTYQLLVGGVPGAEGGI